MQITEITKKNSPVPTSWLIDMYTEYLKKILPYSKELQKPEKRDFLQEIAAEELENTLSRRDTDFLTFFTDEDVNKKNPLGFAIIGRFPNAYGSNDIYIQEFYICERKQGIGREVVKLILERYENLFFGENMDVSMFILEENFPARLFWKNVMEKMGYRELVKTREIIPPSEDRFGATEAELRFEYWRKTHAGT